MKSVLVALCALFFCAAPVLAADVVHYQATMVKNDGTKQPTTVRFDHGAHQERYVAGNCAACHTGPPKKIAISRANAHAAACLDCHKAAGAGSKAPTLCADCHK